MSARKSLPPRLANRAANGGGGANAAPSMYSSSGGIPETQYRQFQQYQHHHHGSSVSYSPHSRDTYHDDQKLSGLLRKMMRDEVTTRTLAPDLKLLREYIENPMNARSVLKQAESSMNKLQELYYKEINKAIKIEVAELIGILGCSLSRMDPFKFSKWIFNCIYGAPSDQVKTFYLLSLQRAIELDLKVPEHSRICDVIQECADNLCKILSEVDECEMLISVVNCLLVIASAYNNSLLPHFEELMDILIGWRLEPATSSKIVSFTTKALLGFGDFWVSNAEHTIKIIGQFIDDIEAYRSDFSKLDTDESSNCDLYREKCDIIAKVIDLINVFGVLTKSLKQNVLSVLFKQVIQKSLKRILVCVCSLCATNYSYSLVKQANSVLTEIIGSSPALIIGESSTDQGSTDTLTESVFNYMFELFSLDPGCTIDIISSCIETLSEVVKVSSGEISLPLFEALLVDNKTFRKYRCCENEQIVSLCLDLYENILAIKDVPSLETVYKIMLSEIQACAHCLMDKASQQRNGDTDLTKSSFSNFQIISEISDPYHFVPEIDVQNAVEIIEFNLTALSPLSSQKSSLIVNYALKPSLFNLFCKKLRVLCVEYSYAYPEIQYSILSLLYRHALASNYFVASCSTGSSKNSPVAQNTFSFSQPTRKHFFHVCELLTACLTLKQSNPDSLSLILTWMSEIVETMAQESLLDSNRAKKILASEVFEKLAIAATEGISVTTSVEAHECFVNFVLGLLKFENLSEKIMNTLSTLTLSMLLSSQPDLVEVYSKLLLCLPIGCFGNSKLVSKDLKSVLCYERKTSKKDLMKFEPSSKILPYDFKFILSGVFTEIDTRQQVHGNNLEVFFHRYADKSSIITFRDVPWRVHVQFLDVCWFYALWEMANLCITGKLKTALGKASETFADFESVLRSHCAKVRGISMEKQIWRSLNIDNLECFGKPQRMLLFLDCLEKQIYNASEGLVCSLPVANKAARTFFRTNRDVCKIWYKQIRVHAACLAQAVHRPASVIHHVTSYFAELQNNEKTHPDQIMELCLMLYWAYIECSAHEEIQGFNIYFQKRFGRQFPYSELFLLQANGSYEDAMYLYACKLNGKDPEFDLANSKSVGLLQTPPDKTSEFSEKSPVLMRFVFKQIASIAESLKCFEEFNQFCENFSEKNKNNDELNFARLRENELQRVKVMQSFDSLDFLSTERTLEKIFASSDQQKPQESILCCVPEWNMDNLCRGIDLTLTEQLNNLMLSKLDEFKLGGISPEKSFGSEDLLGDVERVLAWTAGQYSSSVSKTAANKLLCHGKTIAMLRELKEEEPKLELYKNVIQFPKKGSHADLNQIDSCFRGLQIEKLKRRLIENEGFLLDPRGDLLIGSNLRQNNCSLNLIRTLRKSGCPKVASQILLNSECSQFVQMEKSTLVSKLKENFKLNLNDSSMVRIELNQIKESAKLQSIFGELSGACYKLSSLILLFMKNAQIGDSSFISSTISNLVKILSSENGKSINLEASSENFSPLGKLCSDLGELIGTTAHFQPLAEAITGNTSIDKREATIAALHYLSIGFEPECSKTWYRLASWSFKFGKKAVTQACSQTQLLTPQELIEVNAFLELCMTDATKRSKVVEILQKPHFNALQDEDIVVNEAGALCSDGRQAVRRQVLAVAEELENVPAFDHIMKVWQNACDRIFGMYKLATNSYFKYLTLDSNLSDDSHVTATLRLLRVLVNHAWELQGCLESGLTSTPTKPWRVIIPQLFSRLNHPETYVRKSVTDLLKRIASETPHLIVYPVIVGCEQKISEGKIRSKSGRLITDGTKLQESQEEPERKNSVADTDSEFGGAEGRIDKESSAGSQSLMTSETNDGNDMEILHVEDVENELSDMRLIDGSQDAIQDKDDAEDEDEEVDLNDLYSSRAEIEHCYSVLLETVSQCDLQLVSDLKLFVDELRRVSLLWDELWMSAFMYYSNEAMKAINAIEYERKRLDKIKSLNNAEKQTILTAKYSAFMNPVIFVFEQILELTDKTPETNHENWFVSTFLERIKEALDMLKKPENIRKPALAWEPFNLLYQELSTRTSKKSSLNLQLRSIAPKLFMLKNTSVPLILSETSDLITVQSFKDEIVIMPTKTKPKKISILGNNGVNYSYLFKGLEDLHLDERIMQFLTIVNTMFDKDNRTANNCFYRARNYAVTPLGPRSGLIQWVDGAVPLFGLYKKWQQREAYAAALKKQALASAAATATSSASAQGTTAAPKAPPQDSSSNVVQVPPVPKPSEMFQEKISKCLVASGLSDSLPRRDWPLKVVRQVLDELERETPNYLLWREMWCSCSNSDEWWLMTQQYNSCNALMSIVGYVIGLGDRHLDNILVDLNSGELVHIDYNVCFEKGKNLRVPEKVAFRLTQNLVAALGVTGYEGKFRIVAENVMKTLKKGRETLLTLLEAFVYDPLVDWTTHSSDLGGFMGALQFKKNNENLKRDKRNLDFGVSFSLLSAKIVEIKSSWLKNCDDIINVLKLIPNHFQNLQLSLNAHLEKEKQRSVVQKAQLYLKEAAGDMEHFFWSLEKRDSNAAFYQSIEDEFNVKLDTHLTLCVATLQKFMEAYSNGHRLFLMNILADFEETPANAVPPAGYLESRTYLASVHQLQLLEDCESTDTECMKVFISQNSACLQLAKLLTEYLSVIQQVEAPNNLLQNLIKTLQKMRTEMTTLSENEDENATQNRVSCTEQLKAVIEQPVSLAYFAVDVDNNLISELRTLNDSVVRLSSKLLPLSQNVDLDESKSALSKRLMVFISTKPKEYSNATASVVLHYLATFASQYMHMEVAAFEATDEALKNSKSVGGDWFLDEIESLAGTLKTLSTFVQYYINLGAEFEKLSSQHVNPLIASLSIYTSLLEFYQSVAAETMPEVFALLLAAEYTSEMFDDLDSKLSNIEKESESLIAEIEAVGFEDAVKRAEISSKLELLVEAVTSLPNTLETVLSLVFQAFNRLSNQLETLMHLCSQSEAPPEMLSMLPHFKVLKVSEQVQKVLTVDIKSSLNAKTWLKCCSIKALSGFVRSILTTVNVVKNLKLSGSTKERPQTIAHDVLHCLDPVALFVSSFVRKQVIGLPSACIAHFILHCATALGVGSAVDFCDYSSDRDGVEDVKLELIDQKVRSSLKNRLEIPENCFTQVFALFADLEACCRQGTQVVSIENQLVLYRRQFQLLRTITTKFEWSYYHMLVLGGKPVIDLMSNSRFSALENIKTKVIELTNLNAQMVTNLQTLKTKEDKIEARLKWSAGLYKDSLAKFSSLKSAREVFLQGRVTKVEELLLSSKLLLQFEELQTWAPQSVQLFTSGCQELIELGEKLNAYRGRKVDISPVEKFIVSKLNISAMKVKSNEETRASLLNNLQSDDKQAKLLVDSTWQALLKTRDDLKVSVQPLKLALSTHNATMKDLKLLMRPLNKDDLATNESLKAIFNQVRQYVITHNQFTDNVSQFYSTVNPVLANIAMLKRDQHPLEKLTEIVRTLTEITPAIYADLLSLNQPLTKLKHNDNLKEVSSGLKNVKGLQALHEFGISKESKLFSSSTSSARLLSPARRNPGSVPKATTSGTGGLEIIKRDPRTGKALQERNTYAISVWRKVRSKLDGVVESSEGATSAVPIGVTKRMNVNEQVDFIIKEAVDPNNLAQMYEGWTAWV
ncbi:serine/threonine-protein kinase SMG1-like [Symsagittifera roscoffensis]|uniref:serine/threonine-protein kinase SMG1-like n=1 Tax=Symsagittifera roscoffensis TaxID=84072 RepID=UPI00307BB82E